MENSEDTLRSYYLTSEDRGTAGDTRYMLVFTTRGELVVRMTKSRDHQYGSPDVQDIPARDFSRVTVAGRSLLQLVLHKLNEILPSSD